jgi:hypothetical protein
MQSHSMTEVEIEFLKSQQRPDANVYPPNSGNHAVAHGRGLDPHAHRVLESGSQQQRGQAYNQSRSDRTSDPPPLSAGSKRNHRRRMPQPLRVPAAGRRVADGVDQVSGELKRSFCFTTFTNVHYFFR